MHEATEYLKAERVRLDRFRSEMGFLLGRRRRSDGLSSPGSEPSIYETLIPADSRKACRTGAGATLDTIDRRPLRS